MAIPEEQRVMPRDVAVGGRHPEQNGQALDPGDPIPLNMYEQTDEQLRELGVSTLPRTLLEAVEALDRDTLAGEVLGPELKASFVELKTREWWDYHNTVSSWEHERYLDFF